MLKRSSPMTGAGQKEAMSPESGYSESSHTTLLAENEQSLSSSTTVPTLQNYLQTWTPEETPEMANLVTITVNGISINGYFKNDDVIKLMTAFNVGTTTTLSMPHPVNDENRLTSDLCHSWVQSHHSETTTAKEDCTPAASAFDFKDGDSSFGQVSSTTALRVGVDHTMADKLQPKLACTARETSHAPFGLSEVTMCGAEAVSGLPPDAEDSSEEDPDEVPVVTKWMLEEDLRVSSDDDDDADNGPERPPQAPMTDAIILDGLKLRINKRKIKEAAVAPEPKKKHRSRWSISDGSSSESMEEEDLPLFDDALLSNDSCSSFEDANEENMICESKRVPRALDQGTVVPKETKYKLDMDVWYEQRRQQYAKFIPDAAKKMVTNMQPIVWLERDPYIDRIALDLLCLESREISDGQSDNNSLRLHYESSEDDISLSFNSDGNVDFPNLSPFSSTQDGDIVLKTSDDIQTPQQEQETAAACETACKNVDEVVANDLHDAIDKILAEKSLQPDDSVWQLYQTYHDTFEVDNSDCDQSPENYQLLLNDSDIPESQVQSTLPQADEPMAKPAENLQLDLETQNELPNPFSPDAERAPIAVEPVPVPCEVEVPASIQEASPEIIEVSSEEGNSQAESDEDCIHLDVSDDEFV
ncbi:uncharacterized protein LOC135947965 [Cloeon dipterum]|uniref:uncharacterized protein LOC135947965 n=1 Tax=Cloeon dipterum TaxID=197152 RepID=UPI00321F664A